MSTKPKILDKEGKALILFTLIAVVFIGGYLVGTHQNVEDEIATAQNELLLCHQSEECVKYLNDNFVSEAELAAYKKTVTAAIAHPHIEFDQLATAAKNQDARDDAQDKNILKALNQGIGDGSENTGTSQFSIQLDAVYNSATKRYEVNPGQLINLKANLPVNTQVNIDIDGSGLDYDRGWTSSVTNGKLDSYFQLDDDLPNGVYKLIITQGNKSDSVELLVKQTSV